MQDGEEKVIAYASNKLSKAEKRYCITRKELLAIYKYVIHFKHYLYGRRFKVRTDHQALTWLLNWEKPNTSQYCNWRAELECYDMEVIYRPGKYHSNADALSRLPQCEQCEIKHEDSQKKRNCKIFDDPEQNEGERVICKLTNSSSNWRQEEDRIGHHPLPNDVRLIAGKTPWRDTNRIGRFEVAMATKKSTANT